MSLNQIKNVPIRSRTEREINIRYGTKVQQSDNWHEKFIQVKQKQKEQELQLINLRQKLEQWKQRAREYLRQKIKLQESVELLQDQLSKPQPYPKRTQQQQFEDNMLNVKKLHQMLSDTVDNYQQKTHQYLQQNEQLIVQKVNAQLDSAQKLMDEKIHNHHNKVSRATLSQIQSETMLEKLLKNLKHAEERQHILTIDNNGLKQKIQELKFELNATKKVSLQSRLKSRASTRGVRTEAYPSELLSPISHPKSPQGFELRTFTANNPQRPNRIIKRYKRMLKHERNNSKQLREDFNKRVSRQTEVFELVREIYQDVCKECSRKALKQEFLAKLLESQKLLEFLMVYMKPMPSNELEFLSN